MRASALIDFLEHVAEGLRHADRHAGLRGYCTGADVAAVAQERRADGRAVGPMHASAPHQALHHFVAQAEWSDDEMRRRM